VTTVIIPAAGSGTRFGASTPKQFLPLDGIPILIRTVLVFERTRAIDAIVIAASPDYHPALKEWCAEYRITKCTTIVAGGVERQDSIVNALHTDVASQSDIILVHDAVRPFITPAFVTNIVETAQEHGSVIPGLPPKETVKEVNNAELGMTNVVLHTHNRPALRLIQTPQAFMRATLVHAYQTAQQQGFRGTDDASVVEFAGGEVRVVAGLEENIKITTPMDWVVAEVLIRRSEL
jgi:2-C-methyl-D-erythritol 4-phosphate cytidylyltransferase